VHLAGHGLADVVKFQSHLGRVRQGLEQLVDPTSFGMREIFFSFRILVRFCFN
jgi:hypothetical protein